MLLQGDGNSITLLPALPTQWNEGEVSGICARGGHEISMAWSEGKVTKLSIKSVNDGKLVVNFNGVSKTIKTKGGQKVVIL